MELWEILLSNKMKKVNVTMDIPSTQLLRICNNHVILLNEYSVLL